jgi:hypothetical protein
MASWKYRYVAVSIDGFIEQLVRYVNSGHYFYVSGCVPGGKSPELVDEKLLARYSIVQQRWERSRRKQAGFASVHYLRYDRVFILVATHGRHEFFDSHSDEQIRDCRRVAIRYGGYAIRRHACGRTGKWHTLVRIDKPTATALRAYLTDLALRRSKEQLEDEFRSVCFQPYRPVREQLMTMLRAVNRRRKAAGLPIIDYACIPSRRRITKPFGEEILEDKASASCYSAATTAPGSLTSGKISPSSSARVWSKTRARA